MEIIKIDSRRMMISLSEEDMAAHDIQCNGDEYDEEITRHIMSEVIELARADTGFDTSHKKIEVSMFQSNDGGCELFIKSSDDAIGGDTMGHIKEGIKISTEKAEKRYTYSFRFDTIDMMIRACRQLEGVSFSGESAAYFEKDKKRIRYYMTLSDVSRAQQLRLIKPLSFLSEFGERCDGELIGAYIREHCHCICQKNAVKTIAENC